MILGEITESGFPKVNPGEYYCGECEEIGNGSLDNHWDESHPDEHRPWEEYEERC